MRAVPYDGATCTTGWTEAISSTVLQLLYALADISNSRRTERRGSVVVAAADPQQVLERPSRFLPPLRLSPRSDLFLSLAGPLLSILLFTAGPPHSPILCALR